uniref:PSI-J n=1 Tax=Odontella aurita TaxID=265563 RepID=A0A7S4MN62_9STRA|mmetsp:Transcript_26768/g.79106  ORF Transcript_26768/g.79106 Transcript_26768/m.79106 type:complete len:243 (+) Transcript_26768:154-882(+)
MHSADRLGVALALLATLAVSSAFVVPSLVVRSTDSATARRFTTAPLAARPNGGKDPNNSFESLFTGGAFNDEDEAAVKIATKIRSVKDLGWTGPAKRKGKARPRHRAWGGSSELPVQLKANYDESNPKCVEKWLTQEEFYSIARVDGPAADTVFVALSGGGAFAERDVCEAKLQQWRSGEPKGNSFNESAFLKSVSEGRRDLGLGWVLFLAINGFFVSSIVFPTNPGAKALEGLIANLQGLA